LDALDSYLRQGVRARVRAFEESFQDQLATNFLALSIRGPALGRPLVDTLKGSRYANMKELRVSRDKQEWRFAFAFDPGAMRSSWSAAIRPA
jgi:hypothetical protein